MNKLSVILPVKNPDNGLFLTVQSILDSDFDSDSLEIIIVNDNSTSGMEMLDEIEKNSSVVLIDNKYCPGISGALNAGLNIATGEYIARIDCGDTIYQERFDKQIMILESNMQCNLVASSASVIRSNNTDVISTIHAKINSIGISVSPFSRLPHPTWMFRKDAISAKYDSRFVRCEDYGFLVENFSTDQIVVVDEPQIYYLDDNSDLNLINEIKATFWKLYVVFFLSKSPFYLKFISGVAYLFLRVSRLLITRKKVI